MIRLVKIEGYESYYHMEEEKLFIYIYIYIYIGGEVKLIIIQTWT